MAKRQLTYNILSGKTIRLAQWEHNVTEIKFEGYTAAANEAVYFLLESPTQKWMIPVVDSKVTIEQAYVQEYGNFTAELVVLKNGTTLEKCDTSSPIIKVKVEQRKKPEGITEVTNPSIETWSESIQVLYNQYMDRLNSFSVEATTLDADDDATAEYDTDTDTLYLGIPKGADGEPGEDGDDGISPTVSITNITGGKRVTITDASGDHTADIMDGTDASVTAQSIANALGYEPADNGTVASIEENIATNIEPAIESMSMEIGNKAEYYEATYNSTTFDEIVSAIDSGKICFIKRDHGNNRLVKVPITQYYPNYAIQFSWFDADYYYVARLIKSGNAWSITQKNRNCAGTSLINARTEKQVYIAPYNLVESVDSVLCSTTASEALTAEQQSNARARIGAEASKGEWVLKGTLTTKNKASGVTVDLSNCSELRIQGWTDATGTSILTTNRTSLIYGVSTNSIRNCIALWQDSSFGAENIYCKYANEKNSDAFANTGTAYSWFGKYLREITLIKFNDASLITDCNIEIYAR